MKEMGGRFSGPHLSCSNIPGSGAEPPDCAGRMRDIPIFGRSRIFIERCDDCHDLKYGFRDPIDRFGYFGTWSIRSLSTAGAHCRDAGI